MDDPTADPQQAVATASTPAAEFRELSRSRQREAFFQLPETIQQRLVADLDREELRGFVRRLDPDEVADVLGLADEAVREDVLRQLDADRRERASTGLIAFTLVSYRCLPVSVRTITGNK